MSRATGCPVTEIQLGGRYTYESVFKDQAAVDGLSRMPGCGFAFSAALSSLSRRGARFLSAAELFVNHSFPFVAFQLSNPLLRGPLFGGGGKHLTHRRALVKHFRVCCAARTCRSCLPTEVRGYLSWLLPLRGEMRLARPWEATEGSGKDPGPVGLVGVTVAGDEVGHCSRIERFVKSLLFAFSSDPSGSACGERTTPSS